jgi:hypothetical protein
MDSAVAAQKWKDLLARTTPQYTLVKRHAAAAAPLWSMCVCFGRRNATEQQTAAVDGQRAAAWRSLSRNTPHRGPWPRHVVRTSDAFSPASDQPRRSASPFTEFAPHNLHIFTFHWSANSKRTATPKVARPCLLSHRAIDSSKKVATSENDTQQNGRRCRECLITTH